MGVVDCLGVEVGLRNGVHAKWGCSILIPTQELHLGNIYVELRRISLSMITIQAGAGLLEQICSS